ncbi:2OG-Fe(II) oxygenase family protein [Pseudomonas chlororaphis]|uniref:TIGR02466 family protein n=1 Tax=Pseudomonas chlororaphis TaxID=587753 RepID=UPI001E2BCCF7|nr:TIGR02466 family protein [Pseudomonas chlororaphis]MCB2250324.1 2OG-Fe(II) oxygenase family protein [Pseudomonas chlororaphis]
MQLGNNLLDPERIKIRRLFATPLASIQHPDAERLNAELKAVVIRRMAEDRGGAQRSNDGGWQSANDFPEWGGEACDALVKFAKEFARQLTAVHSEQYGLIEPGFEWTLNAWANVNEAGHSNALHGHPGAFWSGVYWVDAGGREEDPAVGGDIEFIDPRGMVASTYNPALRMRVEDCLAAGFSSTCAASSGTFILFPSWLMHSVQRFAGNRPRISIAFNFGL